MKCCYLYQIYCIKFYVSALKSHIVKKYDKQVSESDSVSLACMEQCMLNPILYLEPAVDLGLVFWIVNHTFSVAAVSASKAFLFCQLKSIHTAPLFQ